MKKQKITVAEAAQQEGSASLVLALNMLFDSDDLNAVSAAAREHTRRNFRRLARNYGVKFARAVRAERRRLLFQELGSNPAKQPYIDECLPEGIA